MKSFASLELEHSHSNSTHDLIEDFYQPCLSKAIKYDMSKGYFSSALMSPLPLSDAVFIGRGGKVRILCSPQLSHSDCELVINLQDEVEDGQTLLANLRELVHSRTPEKLLLARILSSLAASGFWKCESQKRRTIKFKLPLVFFRVSLKETIGGKFIARALATWMESPTQLQRRESLIPKCLNVIQKMQQRTHKR